MNGTKACEVYFKPDAIYIFPQSTTVFGFGIADEPKCKLAPDSSGTEIGQAVLNALQASRHGLPQPKDLREVTRSVLSFTKSRSWKEFARNARLFLLSSDSAVVRVLPTQPADGGAFDHQVADEVTCELIPEAIGRVLLGLVK
jgi:hypothetical protein